MEYIILFTPLVFWCVLGILTIISIIWWFNDKKF